MDARLLATVFGTVFLAELGDKTQLATMLWAAERPGARWAVFLGSAGALVAASALGVAAGAALGQVASPRTLSRIAGAGFVAIGIWTLWRA